MPIFDTHEQKYVDSNPIPESLPPGRHICICKGFSAEPVEIDRGGGKKAFWVVTFESCPDKGVGGQAAYWIQADIQTKAIANTQWGEGRWSILLNVYGITRDQTNFDTESLFLAPCVCEIGEAKGKTFIKTLHRCSPDQIKEADNYVIRMGYDD